MFAAADELGEGSALAQAMPGFRVRGGQIELADAVAASFAGGGHLVAEAGTGIGKSLAYLVPAAHAGRRVVISTATKSLQEQLRRDDLPLARTATGQPLVAAVVKGRANYLCRAQLAAADSRLLRRDLPSLARLRPWMQTTKTGDRDELDHVPSGDLWRELAVGPDRCRGRRCAFIASCYAEEARSRAQAADVVLVNHALYMADLGLRAASRGGVSILPEHDVVVFDEAHLLEDVAAEWLGVRLSPEAVARFATDVERASQAASIEPPLDELRSLALHGERLFGALPAGSRCRLRERELAAIPPDAVSAMRSSLAVVAERLRGTGEDADAVARQADALGFAMEGVLAPDFDATVVWSERGPRGTVELRTAPIDVAPLLSELLFDELESAVLVSATLAIGGSFDHVKRRLGIAGATELQLPSPFDVERNARLYVPRQAPPSGGPGGADPGLVAQEVAGLVRAAGGRSLVLFSSYRQMHAVFERAAPKINFPLLRQGDAPRELLLAQFRDQVHSVLFATTSFWQGVDVPGEALSLVVIDKLPFAPPDDPLLSARAELAERRGGSGFSEIQLPRAAMLLKQGFGRLLRSESDRGVVAVLDDRLLTKGYGRTMIASLPPAPLVRDLEDVAAFLAADVVGAE